LARGLVLFWGVEKAHSSVEAWVQGLE